MKRGLLAWALVVILAYAPGGAFAVSAVFNGDPVNPSTGLPYELLPGFPLASPGPDGLMGTADDVIDATVVGDIDLVVRSGSPSATGTIPPPTAQGGRTALPVGVAGSSAGGGTEVPFTVFLSDGVVGARASSGHLLAATDMDGIPVVVSAFADFDRDGFIGPTSLDAAGASDNRFEVDELKQVGRAVAIFSGGVARGAIAIHAGRPPSQGGLTVALTAMALTGPFDPAFFNGSIPSGPAIASALPFFPQRDLSKLIRDRAVPVGPNTTLQQVIDFVMLPVPGTNAPFALPTNGSSPTIDTVLVNSQTAVRAVFRKDVHGRALSAPVGELVLGTQAPASHEALRLVPVDRWGNPADTAPAMTLSLRTSGSLDVIVPARARRGQAVEIDTAKGVRVVVHAQPDTADGTTGTLMIEHGGVVVGTQPYRIDVRANQLQADIVAPGPAAATIQAAINQVTDRNHDGALVVAIRPGLYQESVVVGRPMVLRGAGAGATVLQGDGTASVVSVTAPNSTVQGITTVSGGQGFALSGPSTLLIDGRAWHNVGAGIAVSGASVQVLRDQAAENGADGVLLSGATGAVCSGNYLIDNGGAGARLANVQSAQLDNNLVSTNAAGGVTLDGATASGVIDNRFGNNVGAGIQLLASQNCQILGNLSTLNDDDGVRIDSKGGSETSGLRFSGGSGSGKPTSDNLISGNTVDTNNGYGLFVRRSPDDDFSAASGLQAPPGDNGVTNNRKGDVFVRAD